MGEMVSNDHHGVFICIIFIDWKDLTDLGSLGEHNCLSDAKRALSIIWVALGDEGLPGD